RSQGVPDRDLGGLVLAPNQKPAAIDIDLATRDPDALGLALMQPHRDVTAAIGPHTVAIIMTTHVTEGGKAVTDLSDKTAIELGAKGAFHALYTNSGDYGREATYVDGMLYLRPRYQRWHQRAPESADEPAQMLDEYFEPVAATWDLLAPGV